MLALSAAEGMASFLNLLPLTKGEIREREQLETFSAAC
jgi:hypothetical protein